MSSTSDTLVMCSYVQRSTVLARRRGGDQEASPPVQVRVEPVLCRPC